MAYLSHRLQGLKPGPVLLSCVFTTGGLSFLRSVSFNGNNVGALSCFMMRFSRNLPSVSFSFLKLPRTIPVHSRLCLCSFFVNDRVSQQISSHTGIDCSSGNHALVFTLNLIIKAIINRIKPGFIVLKI